MPEYASMPEYPLIHGIITNICDIIINKRGSPDMGIQRPAHKKWPVLTSKGPESKNLRKRGTNEK